MADERDEQLDEKPVKINVVDRRHWATDDEDDNGDGRSDKPTFVAELEQRLAEAEGQVATIRRQYREAKAELEEARARMRRELTQELEGHKKSLLGELVGVLDDLDLALSAARDSGDDAGLRKGVEMVHQRFLATLEGLGVNRVPAMGEAFDPELHEAITTVPVEDPEQDNVVVGVIKETYRLGDQTLRPGQVAVGKHSA